MDHEVDRVLGLAEIAVAVVGYFDFDRDPDVGKEDSIGKGKGT